MPIARKNTAIPTEEFPFSLPASEDIPLGALVSLTRIDGEVVVELAHPLNADRLLGFAKFSVVSGAEGKYLVTRGSRVTPISDAPLTPNQPVFAVEDGKVSNTPPEVGVVVSVGFAVSPTQIVFITDQQIFNGI
tara:strand:- start:349 stop:750 length:402 start_codon:yes stop_codon:yes gene_type:complete